MIALTMAEIAAATSGRFEASGTDAAPESGGGGGRAPPPPGLIQGSGLYSPAPLPPVPCPLISYFTNNISR
jgi:hypothetical protein